MNRTRTQALAEVWNALDGDPAALAHVHYTNEEPIYASPFAIDTAAAAVIGASALSAAHLWHEQTGRWQEANIDSRHASVAYRSERFLRSNGKPVGEQWHDVSGYYRTADDRYIHLHCNFPHFRERTLTVLNATEDRDDVARAVSNWSAHALEEAVIEADSCAFVLRNRDEWIAHPQGKAVATLPLLTIERTEGTSPEPLPSGEQPLSGIRVLDLTRVIAGPLCGRTLAAYGAEVLRVGGEHLPWSQRLVADTSFGKRFAFLDLRTDAARDRLRTLASEADVVVQGYRPGTIAGRGFGYDDVRHLRPGTIYLSLSAWSEAGPWAGRRGYDSLVQTASGIAHEGGIRAGLEEPRPLPAQALDHSVGYLAAAAIMTALAHRARQGGSYEIRVSLAQTGRWFDSLGRVEKPADRDPTVEDIHDFTNRMPSDWGELEYIRPAGMLSETPPRWTSPPPRPGADEATWS
jgi:crotonobetainyl-CoA:carnitine CoA-transferase CaiB-like acyl-CoA transferase